MHPARPSLAPFVVALLVASSVGCGPEPTVPDATPKAPERVLEVGAPAPIAVPEGLDASPGGATAGTPAAPSEEWAGTELREEFFPDGRLKLSRRVRRTDDGIENHGPFRKGAPNGVVLEEGTFRAGEKDGLYVVRHDNGIQESEIHYRAGVEHGEKREWDEFGTLLYEATLVDGQIDGAERAWWPNKERRSLAHYRLGVLHGRQTIWHGNGIAAEDGEWVDGQREGPWNYRTDKDLPLLSQTYSAGRLHGLATEYDELGRVLAEREYQEGRASGLHREYWPDGSVRSETTFAEGRPEGPSARWYENGQKEWEGSHREGQREGLWTFWREDGSIDAAQSGTYRDGVRASGS